MSTAVEQALERLESLLQEKQEKIDSLEQQLQERDGEDAWEWTRHQVRSADPSPGLPVPRLEIRYRDMEDSGYVVEALYCLVYRHLTHDTGGLRCDGAKDCLVFVPMGHTKITGGATGVRPEPESGIWDGKMYGPFRDGAHIRHDMKHLMLPGFIVATDGQVYEIDLDAEAKRRAECEFHIRGTLVPMRSDGDE